MFRRSPGPSACSANGTCVAYNTCSCTGGYQGTECQDFYCNGIISTHPGVCSGHGICNTPNHCNCESGYEGQYCTSWKCGSVYNTDSSVCSGHGQCSSRNNCTCDVNYSGASCNITSCFGTSSIALSVCSSHGTCGAYNTCTCSSCYAGSNCQIYMCAPTTIVLAPANQSQVFYYNGLSNNITVRSSTSYSSEVGNMIYCLLRSGVNFAIVPTKNLTTTDYQCLIPQIPIVLSANVSLVLSRSGTNVDYTLSTNIIPLTFVKYGSLTLRTDNYYDMILAGEPNWKIAFFMSEQLVSSDQASNVQCHRQSDGSALITRQLGSNSYECSTTEPGPSRTAQFTLRLQLGTSYILLSSPVNISVIQPGTIGFYPNTASGSQKSTYFYAIVTLQAALTSTILSRFSCVVDMNVGGSVYATNFAFRDSSSDFYCLQSVNTVGARSLDLYIGPPTGSSASMYKFSTNSLPLVISDYVTVASPRVTPFLSTQVSTNISVPISSIVGNVDSYFNFGSTVTYQVAINTFITAQWDPVLSVLNCTQPAVMNTLTQGNYGIVVYLQTVATQTYLLWASTPNAMWFYTPSAVTTLSPFIISYDASLSISSQQVTINLATPIVASTCQYVYALYNNGATTVRQAVSCNADMTQFTFTVTITNFDPSGTTTVPLRLAYGYLQDYSATITTSDVYITYIRTPIDFIGSPTVFQPSTLGTYNLSFPIPDPRAGVSFSVLWYQDLSSIGVSTPFFYLTCNYSAPLTYPQCVLPNFTAIYIPIKLRYVIYFGRVGQLGDYPSIPVTPHMYKQPINILSVTPYFADTVKTNSTTQLFTFTTDVELHPWATYICQGGVIKIFGGRN